MKLTFEKEPKKDANINVRVQRVTVERLKALAGHYKVSQGQVIERLIEMAHSEIKKKKA